MPDMPLDRHVGRIPLSNYRTPLRHYNFLTLDGILAEAFNHRLGNRSALEDVVDLYQVKTGAVGL